MMDPKHPKTSLSTGNRFLPFTFQEIKGKSFWILDIPDTDKQSSQWGTTHISKVVESGSSFLILKSHFPDSDQRSRKFDLFFIKNVKVWTQTCLSG